MSTSVATIQPAHKRRHDSHRRDKGEDHVYDDHDAERLSDERLQQLRDILTAMG